MPSKDPKVVCSEMLFSYVNLNTALSPYKSVGVSLAGLDIGMVSMAVFATVLLRNIRQSFHYSVPQFSLY